MLIMPIIPSREVILREIGLGVPTWYLKMVFGAKVLEEHATVLKRELQSMRRDGIIRYDKKHKAWFLVH